MTYHGYGIGTTLGELDPEKYLPKYHYNKLQALELLNEIDFIIPTSKYNIFNS